MGSCLPVFAQAFPKLFKHSVPAACPVRAERFNFGRNWRAFSDDLTVRLRHSPDLRFLSQLKNVLLAKRGPRQGIPVVPVTALSRAAVWAPGAGGFSLVEVVIALGLFAFAIVPLIGLMGGGLKISEDSIQSSNLAEIYRHASARIASTPTATAIDPMYFTFSGEVATNASSQIYRLTFSNVASADIGDAARGLVSRKLWRLQVTRAANTGVVLDDHFLMSNQDPVDALQ